MRASEPEGDSIQGIAACSQRVSLVALIGFGSQIRQNCGPIGESVGFEVYKFAQKFVGAASSFIVNEELV